MCASVSLVRLVCALQPGAPDTIQQSHPPRFVTFRVTLKTHVFLECQCALHSSLPACLLSSSVCLSVCLTRLFFSATPTVLRLRNRRRHRRILRRGERGSCGILSVYACMPVCVHAGHVRRKRRLRSVAHFAAAVCVRVFMCVHACTCRICMCVFKTRIHTHTYAYTPAYTHTYACIRILNTHTQTQNTSTPTHPHTNTPTHPHSTWTTARLWCRTGLLL
jgi:hypothetical protein